MSPTMLRLTVPPGSAGRPNRPGCDFCANPSGRWILDARDIDFVATGPFGTAGYESIGSWVACDGCLPFIQRGDVDGLANRVARTKHCPAGLARMTTLAFRRRHFQAFYLGLLRRLGPARPLTLEMAERWQDAMASYRPEDEASARAVAATLEAS